MFTLLTTRPVANAKPGQTQTAVEHTPTPPQMNRFSSRKTTPELFADLLFADLLILATC
jgi:hypothetical protein